MVAVERAQAAPFCSSGTRGQCVVMWLLCIGRQAEDIRAHDTVGLQLWRPSQPVQPVMLLSATAGAVVVQHRRWLCAHLGMMWRQAYSTGFSKGVKSLSQFVLAAQIHTKTMLT